MKNIIILLTALLLTVFTQSCNNANSKANKIVAVAATKYVCMPCGRSCDTTLYEKPGSCKSCMMDLVDKATVNIKNIAPGSICNFIVGLGNEKLVLLDVRTPEEFNGTVADKFGRLAGAINIPVQELEKRITELKAYKDKEIIVYCSHSHRSPMASYMLMQHGFTKVTNMEYGMSEWHSKASSGKCNDSLYVKQ
jgi:rhodanese-related sulfurtransferase/predicted nucleic-acid-binding Zn-ribbon protein